MAMWEELGIVPTADAKAIRRAYAGRLRGLDPDQDPAAFQRLRQAFEAALSQAERPTRAAPQTPRAPPGHPTRPKQRHRANTAAARCRTFPSQYERGERIAA